MNGTPAHSNDPYSRPATAGAGTVLASPWARLVAFVLDTVIPAVLVGTPLLFSGLIPFIEAIAAGELPDSVPGMDAGASVAVIMLLAWTVLTTILVARNGQTVGKKLVGIKVVRSDGSKAGINRLTWLRNVVNALPSLIPVVGLVAGPVYWIVDSLFIFGDARQCIHDRIADTIVIRA
jgi:uncharacterized RDD family membrane protein YckC